MGHQFAPRLGTYVYDPYTSTHTIIRVTAKKRHQFAPRFGTYVYDPYTSTHTIIRVTVKKRHQLAPRFGTPMYVRPIYQHSHHHKSNCQIPSPSCTQIWDPYVCMTHIPATTSTATATATATSTSTTDTTTTTPNNLYR